MKLEGFGWDSTGLNFGRMIQAVACVTLLRCSKCPHLMQGTLRKLLELYPPRCFLHVNLLPCVQALRPKLASPVLEILLR